MVKRIKCRRFFCWKFILEQTANDTGGLCARCSKRKNPNAWKRVDPEVRYENELKVPAVELSDRQKRRQLIAAIGRGDERRIEELLACDMGILEKQPSKFTTWLSDAISENCNLSILERLIKAGCNPNSGAKSPDQTTPLEIAVRNNRTDVMEWLIGHGADPNIGRPMVGAIHYEKPPETQLRMLGILMDAGADLNRSYPLYGDESHRFTVLDWALLYGVSLDVIDYLESRGAVRHWADEKLVAAQRDLKPRKIVPEC